jgi:hypothetical protein
MRIKKSGKEGKGLFQEAPHKSLVKESIDAQ